MKPGDLVTMDNSCGGPPGELRCETALVVSVVVSHYEYRGREIHECTLMCKCGMFEEYADRLELINESKEI